MFVGVDFVVFDFEDGVLYELKDEVWCVVVDWCFFVVEEILEIWVCINGDVIFVKFDFEVFVFCWDCFEGLCIFKVEMIEGFEWFEECF